jgi:hypothetical protein
MEVWIIVFVLLRPLDDDHPQMINRQAYTSEASCRAGLKIISPPEINDQNLALGRKMRCEELAQGVPTPADDTAREGKQP